MQIPTKEVRDGKHTSKVVWICDFNRPDLAKKPLRNVPPTKVLIRDNECLPSNKRIYYSTNHFVKLNLKDQPTSTIISPVDNTGFRSRSGNELYIFDNENECIEKWKELVNKVIKDIDYMIANVVQKWIDDKERLKALVK